VEPKKRLDTWSRLGGKKKLPPLEKGRANFASVAHDQVPRYVKVHKAWTVALTRGGNISAERGRKMLGALENVDVDEMVATFHERYDKVVLQLERYLVDRIGYEGTSVLAGRTLPPPVYRMRVREKILPLLEAGMLEISDEIGATSSMMPQKKNATICEHLRWAMGAISGMYNQLATGCHAVPYGDVMEVMFMPRVAEQLAEKGAWICSRMAKLVENLHVREEVMLRHAREGFSTASELAAVTFRRKEVPWRVCHAIVAGVVRRLDSEGRTAAEMTPELVDEIAVEITGEKLGLTAEEIAAATDPVSFVNAHDSRGGVAPAEVERMIAGRRSRLDEAREAQARRRARLAAADERLDAAVRAILGPD